MKIPMEKALVCAVSIHRLSIKRNVVQTNGIDNATI